MQFVKLGKTNLTVNKNGFGALPIQRIETGDAVKLLRRAFDGGINYFDTARNYSDSEEKLGLAFASCRKELIISTKTASKDAAGFFRDLDTSLTLLKTDYIDLYQLHNPAFCPVPGDESGLYDALIEAKKQGKIRHIGITNHRMAVALAAVQSGLYETIQFPFSYLASDADRKLVSAAKEANMGFIAMKALSGGLIHNAGAAYAFLAEYPHVEPIWGIQRQEELDEFLSFQENRPRMNDAIRAAIRKDRAELSGDFCRGCGYCMPCPAGIEINTCARMSLLLRRSPTAPWLSERWQNEMRKIEDCRHCGHCTSKCPYGLDTPALLSRNYEDYKTFLA